MTIWISMSVSLRIMSALSSNICCSSFLQGNMRVFCEFKEMHVKQRKCNLCFFFCTVNKLH